MHITILVGTVHGTAASVAQALQWAAQDPDLAMPLQVEILPMDGLDIAVFDREGAFIVCTSTTGAGDVPGNAEALYQSLDSQPRYLGHVYYSLVALGDSSYGDTFYGGARRFDEKLQDLGARRVGDVCVLDALETTQPEVDAVAWFGQWIQQGASAWTKP